MPPPPCVAWSPSPASRGRNQRPIGAPCARGASAQNVLSAGHEYAGAARLAPDALVARPGRTVVVVAGHELALVDPQFAVEEMQLFYARMGVRRVARAGCQAYQ